MSKKKIIAVVLFVIGILVAFILFTFFQMRKYMDSHTWATVSVNASWTNDQGEKTGGKNENELLKGDVIDSLLGCFEIKDISTDGTIVIELKSGVLYDANGNVIRTETIHLNETKTFYSEEKYETSITVVSNRYE